MVSCEVQIGSCFSIRLGFKKVLDRFLASRLDDSLLFMWDHPMIFSYASSFRNHVDCSSRLCSEFYPKEYKMGVEFVTIYLMLHC